MQGFLGHGMDLDVFLDLFQVQWDAFPHVSSNSLIRSGVAISNAYRQVMRVQALWVGVIVLLQLIMAMQECKTNQCFQRSLLTNENVDIEMFM